MSWFALTVIGRARVVHAELVAVATFLVHVGAEQELGGVNPSGAGRRRAEDHARSAVVMPFGSARVFPIL